MSNVKVQLLQTTPKRYSPWPHKARRLKKPVRSWASALVVWPGVALGFCALACRADPTPTTSDDSPALLPSTPEVIAGTAAWAALPAPTAHPTTPAVSSGGHSDARNSGIEITEAGWGALVDSLSEPEQDFFSANVLSNEGSYTRAAHWLESLSGAGSAYLGVGPEQNLNFIAWSEPTLAFIVDIRRDNLLLHLLFKSLFLDAENAQQWLAMLLSRVPPSGTSTGSTLHQLLQALPSWPVMPQVHEQLLQRTLHRMQHSWRLAPRQRDAERLAGLCRILRQGQLQLRFDSAEHSSGAAAQKYPSLHMLLLAKDEQGKSRHFLADATLFKRLRRAHSQHRIVPLVGDLAGDQTLPQLASELERRGLKLGVAYVSNVEQYLLLDNKWSAWQRNLHLLPWTADAWVLRTYYDRQAPLPGQAPQAWEFLREPLSSLLQQRAAPSDYRALALRSLQTAPRPLPAPPLGSMLAPQR